MSRKKKSAGSQLNSANHQLAHDVLPYYLRNHEEQLLKAFLMSGTDLEEFLKFMSFLVFKHCEATDQELEKLVSEFELVEERVAEDLVFIILKMPDPKKILEAKYLLFAFIVQDENVYLRYFPYELGLGNDRKQQVYFVCEWDKSGAHLNYNYLEESGLESFVNRVKEILFKNLSWNVACVPPVKEEN
ncbi:MAG: hypothetical protein FWC26_09250 [Fibromonadales bacterium]|nr:hypothetical protein [Fibromonadales bacterium]